MSVSDSYVRPKWRGTPRPITPDRLSWESFQTSTESHNSGVWQPQASDVKHRHTEVSGWVCIPRSVVMATTLNERHVDRLRRGSLTTIRDVIDEKRGRAEALSSRNPHHRSKLSKSCRKARPTRQVPKKDYYENLLEENLTDIKALVQRVGPYLPERYKVVPAFEGDLDYEEDRAHEDKTSRNVREITNVERALSAWKHGFVPASTDLTHFKQDNYIRDTENVVSRQVGGKTRCHVRPFTADSTLRSQSDKASEAAFLLSTSTSTSRTSKPRKTESERRRFKWEKDPEARALLPAYPRRVVRNRPHVDHMTLHGPKRPIMTPTGEWFPLSFSAEVRGKLVRLNSDMYGYQSFAEYTELCKSLDDGLVVIEQPIHVGDKFKFKILATDYRKDLFCLAVNTNQPVNADTANCLPSNRLQATPSSGWNYSDEIRGSKPNDEISITCDALGRLKCSINDGDPIVAAQLDDGTPRHVAICLGLGVTKVQLLGGTRNCRELTQPPNAYEIVPGILIRAHLPSPFFDYCPENEACSFCSNADESTHPNPNSPFALPYACYHVKICDACRQRVECRLCRAPLCWASCPLCDTRLQSY